MKILVVSQYYYPEQFRITDICEALVNEGNQVTVIAGIPNYPEGEVFKGYEHSYKKVEIRNGVEVIRCNNRPRYRGAKNLLLNYISFVLKANRMVNKLDKEYDVVYVYEISPITMAIPAIRYKKKKNIPLYIYCMDLWPECMRDMLKGKLISVKNPVYLFAKKMSSYIYRQADKIGVKYEGFIEYLVDTCGVKRDRIDVLHEHAEAIYLEVSERPIENKCYDFVFLGNIGVAQKCNHILKAIKKMGTKKAYKVHFVGEGSALSDLKKETKELGLEDKVVFHGRFPLSEIKPFYELADCCLVTLSDSSAVGMTPPGKIYGYMAAGKPIIAAAGGPTKEMIEHYDCGQCVGTDDIDGLARIMRNAIENPDEMIEKGRNGRKEFMENFTLQAHISGLLNQLNDMKRKYR